VDKEIEEGINSWLDAKIAVRYAYIFEGDELAEGACITKRSDGKIEFQPFEFKKHSGPPWLGYEAING
jgi:hypothetical protein